MNTVDSTDYESALRFFFNWLVLEKRSFEILNNYWLCDVILTSFQINEQLLKLFLPTKGKLSIITCHSVSRIPDHFGSWHKSAGQLVLSFSPSTTLRVSQIFLQASNIPAAIFRVFTAMHDSPMLHQDKSFKQTINPRPAGGGGHILPPSRIFAIT